MTIPKKSKSNHPSFSQPYPPGIVFLGSNEIRLDKVWGHSLFDKIGTEPILNYNYTTCFSELISDSRIAAFHSASASPSPSPSPSHSGDQRHLYF